MPLQYKLVMTDAGGEVRFISAIARKLASLGALTHGDRRANSHAGLGFSAFAIDNKHGEEALVTLLHDIASGIGSSVSGWKHWRGAAW